ncbi:MAG: hypothetical protein KAT58_08655 [candidate division Zixibacteria bacterium]|nr:hypothetical protein [candidate division Zixibacteria bacterium]
MKLKEKLQYSLIRYKCARLKEAPFDFPKQMQEENRIIITLPEGIETNSILLRMVSELPTLFPTSDLLIVVPIGCTEVARKTGIHAMSPDLYSTNILGLPRRSFFAKVKGFGATMLIDFETHKNVFNTMVNLWSGAILRIGIAGVWGMPIHNFQVRSSYITDELKVYRSLVDVITQIQQGTVVSA